MEKIYISNKDIDKYLSACFYALNNGDDEVQIVGRGNNTKRTIDVAAILLRKYLEVPSYIPTQSDIMDALEKEDITKAKEMLKERMTCEIIINSEPYDERFVSTLDIILRGKRKK